MSILKKLRSLYWKARFDFPIWLDRKLPRPYLKLWKHYLARTEKSKRKAVMRLYELAFGRGFNLDDPHTFNEKIQWLKIYGDLPLQTRLADKYLVREYVREKIGESSLVPLLGVWNSAEEVDFDQLPDRFVLKANHGSGMNLITLDKSKLDRKKARKQMKKWLKTNFAWYFMELQYRDIPRKLIAEEYLENQDGSLSDYKIWCVDGKAIYVEYLAERRTGVKAVFFSRTWERLNFVHSDVPYLKEVPKPEILDEMLAKAEILAENIPYVRVDFYCLDGKKLFFGEMTFSPLGGLGHFEPEEMDRVIGEMIRLPAPFKEKTI